MHALQLPESIRVPRLLPDSGTRPHIYSTVRYTIIVSFFYKAGYLMNGLLLHVCTLMNNKTYMQLL